MEIRTLYEKRRPVISFELFPPRSEKGLNGMKDHIAQLAALDPDFISVTCHNHVDLPQYTKEMCEEVQKHSIPALAHLSAYGHTQATLEKTLDNLLHAEIYNVLALRGDVLHSENELQFADSLALLETIQAYSSQFHCAGTCYPTLHPDSQGWQSDLRFLKQKAQSGATFLISQLFFDNEQYFDFVNKVRASGLEVPISAGIMPVTNKRQVERICQISGVEIPPKYKRILERYEHRTDALFEAGIAYATEQIIDLVTQGVDGIHLYTLNNIQISQQLVQNVQKIVHFE